MRALAALSRFVGNTFAYWVLLFAVLAFLFPSWFISLKTLIVPLLGLVMFGMGLTLKLEDFSEVCANPWRVALGVVAHFVIMPGVAWLLCQAFHLPPEIAVGVILVGCCPSGTSSNVMTWLAKGDLALSVAIAAVTTLLAPLLTPALIWLLASAWLPVSFMDMFWSILQLVMLPIVLGVLATSAGREGQLCGGRAAAGLGRQHRDDRLRRGRCQPSENRRIRPADHGRCDPAQQRSVSCWATSPAKCSSCRWPSASPSSLEVGMQNSGLGAALASAHFSPLAAVPSALFSVWHNISGALLSTYFRKMEPDAEGEPGVH
jgi:BASS family bile acid:Na+ symporter